MLAQKIVFFEGVNFFLFCIFCLEFNNTLMKMRVLNNEESCYLTERFIN